MHYTENLQGLFCQIIFLTALDKTTWGPKQGCLLWQHVYRVFDGDHNAICKLQSSYKGHLNTISNGEISDRLNRDLTLVRLIECLIKITPNWNIKEQGLNGFPYIILLSQDAFPQPCWMLRTAAQVNYVSHGSLLWSLGTQNKKNLRKRRTLVAKTTL